MNIDFTCNVNKHDLRLVYSEIRIIYAFEFNRQIAHKLYIGAMYTGSNTKYKFDQGTTEDNDLTQNFLNVLE